MLWSVAVLLASSPPASAPFESESLPAAMAFSPDGRLLVAAATEMKGDFASVKVWDLQTGEVIHREPTSATRVIHFSTDSRWVAFGSEGSISTFDRLTGASTRHGGSALGFASLDHLYALARENDYASLELGLLPLGPGEIRLTPLPDEPAFNILTGTYDPDVFQDPYTGDVLLRVNDRDVMHWTGDPASPPRLIDSFARGTWGAGAGSRWVHVDRHIVHLDTGRKVGVPKDWIDVFPGPDHVLVAFSDRVEVWTLPKLVRVGVHAIDLSRAFCSAPPREKVGNDSCAYDGVRRRFAWLDDRVRVLLVDTGEVLAYDDDVMTDAQAAEAQALDHASYQTVLMAPWTNPQPAWVQPPSADPYALFDALPPAQVALRITIQDPAGGMRVSCEERVMSQRTLNDPAAMRREFGDAVVEVFMGTWEGRDCLSERYYTTPYSR